ncbi:MAG: hypothetical protein ACC658_13080 [Acidimicrobiia bacterium]
MGGSILGAAVKRVEDPRLIIGEGRYLQDIEIDGALWMVPVRSTIPHGELGDIDIDAATVAPGVVRVYLAGPYRSVSRRWADDLVPPRKSHPTRSFGHHGRSRAAGPPD